MNPPEASKLFDELIARIVKDPSIRLGDLFGSSLFGDLRRQAEEADTDRVFVVPVRRADGIEVLTGPPMARERKAKRVQRGA